MNLLKLIRNADTEHSRRVSQITGLMARRAGYSQAESRMIEQAALFHDAGKAAIPQSILNKPSSLTPAEISLVKTHTSAGAFQLSDAVRILSLATILAEQHHEHIDGNGYHHLSGDEIHPYAKLVACADVFDALYSRRAYKEPWSVESIKDYFAAKSGKQFDSKMTLLLLSIIDDILTLY